MFSGDPIAQDSHEGDETLAPEFTINGGDLVLSIPYFKHKNNSCKTTRKIMDRFRTLEIVI